VRSKTPIAKNPADGVLLFHGWKWLDEVENLLSLSINFVEWMIDTRYVVSLVMLR
jgi:hypothetical protein